MTNFDFLKNFNKELYEIGVKLEEDVIKSPRAVTADATLFLECLVKDIYRITHNKLDPNLISFYKKTDNLYRLGEITYIYKGKLQDAYNLRNKIHNENLNEEKEKKLAYDLHKRLYYISKKYFRDYCDEEKFIQIPDYKKPTQVDIHFDTCIICGSSNLKSISNMCKNCNQKIENANFMLSVQNTLQDYNFTRDDLIELGIDEGRSILLLMDLSKYNAVTNHGHYYTINQEKFDDYLSEINLYVEIGTLITKFYKDEIEPVEIKKTDEYIKGSQNQKPYREFYKLVNRKLEKTFEDNLLKFEDIAKSMKLSSMDEREVQHWFYREKESFIDGSLNEPFILYNEIMINDFFRLKKKGLDDKEALKELKLSYDIYYFWLNQFMGGGFYKKSRNVKREIIIKELKKNRTLNDAIDIAGMSREEFDKMYLLSKDSNDEFYKKFEKEYTQKRQRLLIKHLQKHNLNKAIKLSKITRTEFLRWYYQEESNYSDFYKKTTQLLMEKYLFYRRIGWNKKGILKHINVSKDMYDSWSRHSELDIFNNFKNKNSEITASLVKKGLVINGIKEGKGKEEAIFSANMTPREFLEIYNTSKKEKTDFHLRFDLEYEKSRKKKFIKHIEKEDFYNSILKSEISQKDFNKWYVKDQDTFIASNIPSEFYLTTTKALMEKYLQARRDGKNKPDAAKSVGLSNTIINRWLKHPEFDLFYEFSRENKQVTIDLVVEGFKANKTKSEVSVIYDIPVKTIEDYIELGKNGFIKYEELFDLYENNVIPNHLDVFLNYFKNKSFNKSLKKAKLTKKEVYYYSKLGQSGNIKFKCFYNDYLDMKIGIYVDNILSKKSAKIACKNSSMTSEEFKENLERINDLILNGRFRIIEDYLVKHKTNGLKLASIAGMEVDEIYDWYFRGKDGEEKYVDFALVFEIGLILPRVFAYCKAKKVGISKNWLEKRFKKDLGSADYEIWKKFDIFNQKDLLIFNMHEILSEDTIISVFKNFDFLSEDDPYETDAERLEFVKNVINYNFTRVIKGTAVDQSKIAGN